MSKTRHIDTITDYLIVAFSPALVMFMVGSLVFFAINCFYVGSFDTRLYFATGLFVFAAVLIARISIDEGREYASMFAIPLSITTILSIMRYTDVNLLLILPLVGFIWWSTDKLTWDCTVVDTKKDASGEGLLQTIGMDGEEGAGENAGTGESGEHVQEHLDAEATTNKKEADSKTIWQWWLDRRRRNHTPGVWVIYFGLAAIPIFGLGQMLLPERQYGPSFFLLCIYVASALSLLMATSFLQMRRYLNQRRLPFTDAMAGVWLSNGGVIIVALMLLCLLLPRPNTGYSLIDQVSKIGSKDQKASRTSPYKKNAINDEDQEGDGESDEEAESDSEDGTQTSKDAEQGSNSGEQAKSKGKKKSESGVQQSGDSDESDNGDESNDNAKQSDDSSNGDEGDDSSEGDDGKNESESEGDGESGENSSGKSEDTEDDSEEDESNSSRASPSSKPTPPQLPNLIPEISMPSIPKLVYFVLIGALVLFAFLRYGRQIGAAINAFLRDLAEFLRRLFGGKPRSRVVEEEEQETAIAVEPPRPFSSFPDPFAMGTADRYTPQQLVTYTFEALQAWAYERDCSRSDEQTAMEFATQIAGSHKQVGPAARNLAMLYNQVAYAPGTIGADSLDHVKTLWKTLRTRS